MLGWGLTACILTVQVPALTLSEDLFYSMGALQHAVDLYQQSSSSVQAVVLPPAFITDASTVSLTKAQALLQLQQDPNPADGLLLDSTVALNPFQQIASYASQSSSSSSSSSGSSAASAVTSYSSSSSNSSGSSFDAILADMALASVAAAWSQSVLVTAHPPPTLLLYYRWAHVVAGCEHHIVSFGSGTRVTLDGKLSGSHVVLRAIFQARASYEMAVFGRIPGRVEIVFRSCSTTHG